MTSDNPKAVLGSLGGAALGAGIAALAGGEPCRDRRLRPRRRPARRRDRSPPRHKDKEIAAQTAQRAFETNRTGQASTWKNPDSGNSGSITPTKTYQSAGGQYCREYQQTITVGGEKHQAYGTACRQPDGSWKIQS